MPVSKLKNLVILILLLANAALLCLLVPRQLAQHRQQQDLNTSLTTLCAAQNVVLNADTIPDTIALYALELTDRGAAEMQALTALLGEAPVIADTQIEAAAVSRTGKWDNGVITLELQGGKEVGDFRANAKKVLKKMNFELHTMDETVRLSPGIYTITAYQSVLGVPVFSDGLTLTYANSALTKLEGDFYLGTLMRTDDKACCTAAEAVVAFLGARVDLGWVGSAITGLEQGYLHIDTAGASMRLIPVWSLTTDTGSFQINGLTGAVTEVS